MECPSLDSIQRLLAQAVLGRSSAAADADLGPRLSRLIRPSPHGLGGAERVDIYREQFWLRHVPNLVEDYPTLLWALGGEAPFRELVFAYLEACPPSTWDLQRLGERLPEFIANRVPWRDDRLVIDAARLDWAFMEVFDASDGPSIDLGVLARASPEAWPRARVVLRRALRLLELEHCVNDVREALLKGEKPEDRPRPSRSHVVVWRDDRCFSRARRVAPVAWRILTLLSEGRELGEACNHAAQEMENVEHGESDALEANLVAWFGEWTREGWISEVKLGSE